MRKVCAHVGTAELPDHQSLGADRTLVDAGQGLQQSSSPLIDVLEGDVAPQRMDDSFSEEQTLLRIGKVFVEHFDSSDMVGKPVVELHYFMAVLLQDLQLFGGDCQP